MEHTKRQVDMIKSNMFITAVCILFLIKLRWPYNKSLYKIKIRVKQKKMNEKGIRLEEMEAKVKPFCVR